MIRPTRVPSSCQESLVLAPWASRRRRDLLDLLDQLTPKIQELTRALEAEAEKRPVTQRLMTHSQVVFVFFIRLSSIFGP